MSKRSTSSKETSSNKKAKGQKASSSTADQPQPPATNPNANQTSSSSSSNPPNTNPAASVPVGRNVITTENPFILDGYESEGDVTLRTRRGEELTLYSSQRRVGEILLRRSRQMLDINPNNPTDINFLIIGPAQIEIREQTARDLGIVLENTLIGDKKVVEQAARSLVKYVKNSSSIFTTKPNLSEEAQNFLDELENNPNGDNLHVLFHDEAHWGIERDGNVNTFLQMVLEKLKTHESKEPNFLFVQVSATPRVLTFAADNDVTVVKWMAPDLYRHIHEVRCINDCGQELMHQQKQIPRGDMLVSEYSKVLTAWINFLRNPEDPFRNAAFRDARTHYPVTYKALKKSVMDGITPQDAASFEHYSLTGGRDKCLLIRMPNVEQARSLQTVVKLAFGKWTVFECLLYEGSTDGELSQRATGAEPKAVPITNLTTALNKIPAMIIVVEKMQMGSRIPHQTTIFDVRSRYVGSIAEQNQIIKGNECTFIQDVGRMAGYKTRKARILMSLIVDADLPRLGTGAYQNGEDDSDDEDEVRVDTQKFKFEAIHGLMNKNGTPAKKFDEKVYKGLSPYTIILDALPQVGKTGAFLSFLQKLHRK